MMAIRRFARTCERCDGSGHVVPSFASTTGICPCCSGHGWGWCVECDTMQELIEYVHAENKAVVKETETVVVEGG